MAPLTLTILGAGPGCPERGGACSGYLVQGENAVLVDCGSGIAGRVAEHVAQPPGSALPSRTSTPTTTSTWSRCITMSNSDEPRPTDARSTSAAYVPPGGRAFLERLGQKIASKSAMLEDVFDVCEYAPIASSASGA